MTYDMEVMVMTLEIQELMERLLQLRNGNRAMYPGEVEQIEANLAGYRQRLREFTAIDDTGETQPAA
jgi:hypothetical protein